MNSVQHRLALPPGTRIHWYAIESVLGKGGFGITYLARDTNLDRSVAIKEFLPGEFASRDPDGSVHPAAPEHADIYRWGLTRFIEEARVLSRFEHPNIVRVHTVFEDNNTAYMVMAYEQGQSLKALLNQQGTLSEAQVMALLLPILDGLEQVHQQHFIHRDIKPDNIYLRDDGSPVLIDFGSARQALEGDSRTMTTMVSPGYAPFEQYHSKGEEQGPWTDIYSLGATVFRAISGVNPVDAVTRSRALLDDLPDALPPLQAANHPGYSPALLQAVNHALQFRPAARPQSIGQWRAELQDNERTWGVASTMAGQDPAGRRAATGRRPWVLLALAGLVVATGLGLLGWSRYQADPPATALEPNPPGAGTVNPNLVPDPPSGAQPVAVVSEADPQSEAELALQQREEERLQQELEAEQARLAQLQQALQAQKAAEERARQQVAAREAEARREAERQEALRQEALRQEALRQEALRQEALRQEALRQEALRQEALRQEALRMEASQAEFDRRQAPKDDVFGFKDYPVPRPLVGRRTVQVPAASKQWFSSGGQVKRGRQYRIQASGQWRMGGMCNPSDASGQGIYTPLCWDGGGQTVPGFSHGGLIAKIGKTRPAFYVGPEFSFTAVWDGPLYFLSNDAAAFMGDNSGALDVIISAE